MRMSNRARKHNDSKTSGDVNIINVEEIPLKYRVIFQYPFLNKVQSMVFPDVLYTDKSIVVSAPTGSGKTLILELAIIRLLMNLDRLNYNGDFKIVYMAPVKALCTERLMDWYGKFSKLGLPCIEVTGDTDLMDIANLQKYKIIMTTPEKWDSLTRRWKDHEKIVQMVKLFLIDEVHLLKEDIRGPVLEAVVSRMKTIQESLNMSNMQCNTMEDGNTDGTLLAFSLNIRFIAISATIPNAHDIAQWLGTKQRPASAFVIGEEFRPVKLIKIVEGFPCKDGLGLFKFDMGLSYKIRPIIERYCEGKPTLIFCNTRKSVEMTADTLSRELMFQFTDEQREIFFVMSSRITDKKLQVLVRGGLGCHHAGFIQQDRNIVEEMFRQGDLPVLITTSTLAMGVNLPAHLVIIKTTQYYNNGTYREYEDSTVLQMMGRAGRPQFDTEGVAVIMTRNQDKKRYEQLVGGQRAIESSLHRHLAEHLNAEVALGTLPDLLQAMDWIRSTFLYVRAVKNPTHYGFPSHNDRDTIEKRLEELCLKCMNALTRAGMLIMDSNTCVESTEAGLVMAANCLDFETMKLITKIKGTESLNELIEVLSQCHEFGDLPLRNGEKRVLNLLNRKPRGQDGLVCRFPQKGRIQSRDMKINCLIQALFGCLPILDPSLHQELIKVSRIGEHLSKCIMKYLTRPRYINSDQPVFKAVLNSVTLAKCFVAKLWENSPYVVRQFSGIGPTFASLLVSSGKTTFQSVLESNPRDLERIMNKQPPAGNLLKKQVFLLPVYDLQMTSKQGRNILLSLSISNAEELLEEGSTAGDKHRICLIVGDSENNLLLYANILDSSLLRGPTSKEIVPTLQKAHTIYAHCVSNTWVGIDVTCSTEIGQSLNSVLGPLQRNIMNYVEQTQTKINSTSYNNLDKNTITLSPKTQSVFLSDMCEEHIGSNSNKKVGTVKTDRIRKSEAKKKCDKSITNINNLIKTIPQPSQLNTLSRNVNYYKPLPKQTIKNYKYHDTQYLENNGTPCNLDNKYENTTLDRTKIFDRSIPEYIKNFYLRNENDECFENSCENLEKPCNSEYLCADENDASLIKTNYANSGFDSNMPSTSRYMSEFYDQQNNEDLDSIVQTIDDESIYEQSFSMPEIQPLKISEEYETFVLDQTENTSNTAFYSKDLAIGLHNNIDSKNEVEKEDNIEINNTVNQTYNNKTNAIKMKSNKDTPKPTLKKDSTINAYYKQTKKGTNTPNCKRIKLDIQYNSPPKKNREHTEEIIISSPESQCINKFSKYQTIKSKQLQNVNSNTEIKNYNTTGTDGEPQSKQMVDKQTQTDDNYLKDQMLTLCFDNEVSSNNKDTSVEKNNKRTQDIETRICGKKMRNELDKVNYEINPLNRKQRIEINLQINVNETYNQLFIQGLPSIQPVTVPLSLRNTADNEQIITPRQKLVTWSEPLTKHDEGQQDIPTNSNKIYEIEPATTSTNNEITQFSKKIAITKITGKRQKICETNKIAAKVRLNFMSAIQSVTNLSPEEFMELYSMEKINALRKIENSQVAESKNEESQLLPIEKNNELQNVLSSIVSVPNPIRNSADSKDITNSSTSCNTSLEYDAKEHPLQDFHRPQLKELAITLKNKNDYDKNTSFQTINNNMSTETNTSTNTNDKHDKNIPCNFGPSQNKLTNYMKKKDIITENRCEKNFNSVNNVTQAFGHSKSNESTKNILIMNKEADNNIASILQRYATSSVSKQGQTHKLENSTEREFPEPKNCHLNSRPAHGQYKQQQSIRAFLSNNTKHEEIVKCYQDESPTQQDTYQPSYVQEAFKYYSTHNQPNNMLEIENNINDNACEILQQESTISNNNFETNSYQSDDDDDENILDPQKVLALAYSEPKAATEKPQEIVYLNSFEDGCNNIKRNIENPFEIELQHEKENNINFTNTYIEDNFPQAICAENTMFPCNEYNRKLFNTNKTSSKLFNLSSPAGHFSRNEIFEHLQQFKNTPKNTFKL